MLKVPSFKVSYSVDYILNYGGISSGGQGARKLAEFELTCHMLVKESGTDDLKNSLLPNSEIIQS